ncbi:hypothetical protein EDB85DRAFT_2274959 [Lactarius pseudohatsudake]|nr:hypothetical protein EDB85DRAFT_2274959 [Lactarius pseudohatsudake]
MVPDRGKQASGISGPRAAASLWETLGKLLVLPPNFYAVCQLAHYLLGSDSQSRYTRLDVSHPLPTRVLGAASPQDSPRVSPDRVATVMRKVMRLEDETLPGRSRFGVSALQTDVQRDEGWAGSLHSKTPSCARVAACGRTKGSAPTDGWKMSPRRESAQRCGKCSPARVNPDEARIGVSLYRVSSMRCAASGKGSREGRGHPRSGSSGRETCVLPWWGLRARTAGGAAGSSGRFGMREIGVRKGPKRAGCPGSQFANGIKILLCCKKREMGGLSRLSTDALVGVLLSVDFVDCNLACAAFGFGDGVCVVDLQQRGDLGERWRCGEPADKVRQALRTSGSGRLEATPPMVQASACLVALQIASPLSGTRLSKITKGACGCGVLGNAREIAN